MEIIIAYVQRNMALGRTRQGGLAKQSKRQEGNVSESDPYTQTNATHDIGGKVATYEVNHALSSLLRGELILQRKGR